MSDQFGELKPLSKAAVSKALERAERYRLLNEPHQAESICRDVLRVDAMNQAALHSLILALTEQFETAPPVSPKSVHEHVRALETEYDRRYYTGIIHERAARALLRRGTPRSGEAAYAEVRAAMECYEQAEGLRPKGNDDAVLRWNTCVRMIRDTRALAPAPEDEFRPLLE